MMPVTGYLMEAALLADPGEELRLVVGGDRLRRPGGTSRVSTPTFAAAVEAMDDIHGGVTKLIFSTMAAWLQAGVEAQCPLESKAAGLSPPGC